jgi:hypothetical protein
VVHRLRAAFEFLECDHAFERGLVVRNGGAELSYRKLDNLLVFVAEPYRLPLALIEHPCPWPASSNPRRQRHLLSDSFECSELARLRARDERRCRRYLAEVALGRRDAFLTQVAEPFAKHGPRELDQACTEWAKLVQGSPELLAGKFRA